MKIFYYENLEPYGILYYLELQPVSYKHLALFSGQGKQHYNKNKGWVSNKCQIFCGSTIINILNGTSMPFPFLLLPVI